MTINLYVNTSEKEKLDKNLINETVLNGYLKKGSSVINPVITVEINNPSQYNYIYIAEFHRYYFITDTVNVRNNIWELNMHVDALSSFKTQIRANKAIIDKNQYLTNANQYYNDGDTFVHDSKETNEIATFQNGFDETPHYILITAGA